MVFSYCNNVRSQLLFITGVHEKLDQSERDLKIKADVSVTVPDVVQAELANSDIVFEMCDPEPSGFIPTAKTEEKSTSTHMDCILKADEGIVQATTNKTTPVRTYCYVNWDHNKHDQLSELKFAKYYELRPILHQLDEEPRVLPKMAREFLNIMRTRITLLNVCTVNKYNRFPYTGKFVDINLTSKENTELRKLFQGCHDDTYLDVIDSCKITMKESFLDQWLFETIYGLHWTLEPEE